MCSSGNCGQRASYGNGLTLFDDSTDMRIWGKNEIVLVPGLWPLVSSSDLHFTIWVIWQLCQSFPFTVWSPCMKPTLLLFRKSHLVLLATHYSCRPARHGLKISLQFPGSFLRLLRVERHSIFYNTFEGAINSSSKWVVTGIPTNHINKHYKIFELETRTR